MRLLLDQNLPQSLVTLLTERGYDAVDTRQLGLATATDEEILEQAEGDNRIIISADTDFGTILALRNSTRPSYVLLRRTQGLSAEEIAELLSTNLPTVREELETGAIAVFTNENLRIRQLPLGPAPADH